MIVLVERAKVLFCGISPLWEAYHRAAKAVLLYSPVMSDPLNQDCAHAGVPALHILGDDAEHLKGLLTQRKVTVRVQSDVDIDESAQGHVVYGFIEGSAHPDECVVLEAHYDHWRAGANDDNSGIGLSLAFAKAVKDAGLTPKRRMPFMFSSGHQSATSGSKDSHWDWATGPYFFLRERPEFAARIVEALCADAVGEKSDFHAVETTPDLKAFLTRAAKDAGVSDLMTWYVFTPVSSFDSWSYYRAATPAATTYQVELGALMDILGYHRDVTYGIDVIDRDYMAMDTRFRGLAAWRLAQADALAYQLAAESQEVCKGLNDLAARVSGAPIQGLRTALAAYQRKAARLGAYALGLQNPTPAEARELNATMRSVITTVNPYL